MVSFSEVRSQKAREALVSRRYNFKYLQCKQCTLFIETSIEKVIKLKNKPIKVSLSRVGL